MFNPFKKVLKPKLNTPEATPPLVPPVEKGKKAKGGIYLTEYAFNIKWQIMEGRIHNSNIIMTVVLVALTICFLTLFFGYWQFASTSFNDYSTKIKELNDERHKNLENRVLQLENANNTTPTFQPKSLK